MLPSKTIEVVGHRDFRKIYDELSDNSLKKRIAVIINEMKSDVNNGDYIKRKPYPSKYQHHLIANLFVYDIGNTYRLIYTVRTEKDKKTYQYMDLLTHKEYDVVFGYRTS